MGKAKERIISFLLSSVMILTIVFGALPPLKVYAAEGGTGGFRITSPSDGGGINGSETVKIKWKSYSGADHYWIAIKDTSTGRTIVNEECSGTSYSVYSDDDVFTVDGREYKIYVAAMDKNDNVLNTGSAWHAIFVENCMECDHEYEEEIIDSEYDYDEDDYEDHYYSHKIKYTCEYCGDSYTEWTDEDFEAHTWNSKNSTCEYCDCVLPKLTTDFFSVKDEYTLGDVLKFTGSIVGNGSDILRVAVNVQKPGEDSKTHLSSRTVNGEYFNLTNVADLTLDKEGEWGVYIWAVDVAQNGYNSDEAEEGVGTFVYYFDVVDDCDHNNTKNVETWWEHTEISGNDEQHTYTVIYDIVCKDCGVVVQEDLWEDELEDHDFDSNGKCTDCGYILSNEPEVVSIVPASTSVNTVKPLNFTVKTNTYAEHGIAIYASDIFLAEITDYDTYSGYFEYTYEHRFMSSGDKAIYAYPLDANGNAIKDAGSSCSICVNAPHGQIGQPEITTPNYTKVMLGDSIKIKWNKPSSPSSGIVYNLYVYDCATDEDVFVNEELITGTSFTVPASVFAREGIYMVHLYAMAEGYSQNGIAIYLDVCGTDFLLGDVNSDGKITNKDRFVLNRYLENMHGYTIDEKNADIDGDGSITDNDCTILARYLAKWPGYEDLYAYHKLPEETPEVPGATPDEPEEEPFVDTSKWQMSFSSTAVNINVSLKSGTPDKNKDYLFVAENTAGLHHAGTIPAGKTTASFSVSSLQMPRGQYYDYYVVPFDVALVPENKASYRIDSGYLPLYGGSMITSVKSGDRTISDGGTAYVNEPLTIRWDGSLGVDSFRLSVVINDKLIYLTETNHSGPGTVSIDANVVKAGTLEITAIVKAPEGTGLNNAVTAWTGNIIERPIDEREDRVALMNTVNNLYFASDNIFAENDNLAIKEMNDYYNANSFSAGVSASINLALNPALAVETAIKSVGNNKYDAFDSTLATEAISTLVDAMCDEYYISCIDDCTELTTSLLNWVKNKDEKEVRAAFETIGHINDGVINEIVRLFMNAKQRYLDDVNNGLSDYIEKLYGLGFEEDLIMEKYAQIAWYQGGNVAKRQAIERAKTAASTFSKGYKKVFDILGKAATVTEVLSAFNNITLKDYTVPLVKLNVLIEAFESDDMLLEAAQRLQTRYENKLVNFADSLRNEILQAALKKLTGLWEVTTAGFTIVEKNVRAVVDLAYLNLINQVIESHARGLKTQYISEGDTNTLVSLEKTLHSLADCRALMNDAAVNLNKVLFFEIDADTIEKLEYYSDLYHGFHKSIERIFN